MIDLLQLQNDVYGLLLSTDALQTVNIVQERRFMLDAQVELDAIWMTPRNGGSGTGILCELPSVDVTGGNSLPAMMVRVPFVCLQNGDAALTPETGSGLTAETLVQLVLNTLQHQELKGIGTLYAEARAIEPAREFEFINAYRVSFVLQRQQTRQTPRCAPVTITNNAGVITLACATADAEIFYTLDGSTPVRATALDPITAAPINPLSQAYVAPFAVVSGHRVRAVAFAPGYIASQINLEVIA
jgi:hypothetical protein